VNSTGVEVGTAEVAFPAGVVVPVLIGVVCTGATPLTAVAVCVGVGNASVALKELKSNVACAESVACTLTVVVVNI
jgi:hypothetical protein